MSTTVTTNGDASAAFSAALASTGFQNDSLSDMARVQLAIANLITSQKSRTLADTTLSTFRLTQSEVTLTPSTTCSVSGGGSIAGVRGGVTVSASKSFTDGFLYGTQGKVTLNGTIAEVSAARIAGVIGQVDLSTGTVTAGQVSALWGDFQGTPTLTVPDQVNIIRATNSSNGTVNAVLFAYGKASYFATCGADGGAPAYFITTAPSSLAKSLKINVQGTDYYIALYSAAS